YPVPPTNDTFLCALCWCRATADRAAVYLSGQITIDPKTNQLMSNASDQTRRVLDNLTAVLVADGLTMDHVVSTTVFLQDVSDFDKMNGVYAVSLRRRPPDRIGCCNGPGCMPYTCAKWETVSNLFCRPNPNGVCELVHTHQAYFALVTMLAAARGAKRNLKTCGSRTRTTPHQGRVIGWLI